MDKELIFFEVLSSLLKYNRLKLLYEKSVYEESSTKRNLAAGADSEESGWIPNLQNVINAFDTMSFRRVFDSLEKLRNPLTKRYSDIVSPLGLYKEMICYLRLLLESSDETHNEFAIARLYNLFYTTNEKRDPLNRLLLDWAPGMFSFPQHNLIISFWNQPLFFCALSLLFFFFLYLTYFSSLTSFWFLLFSSVSFSFPLFSFIILHLFPSLLFFFSLFFSFLRLFSHQFHLLLYSFSYLLFFSFSAKGTYTRNHLNLLVELVHETLKTLDTAAKKHGSVPSQQQQQKKKQSKVISN